VASRSIGIPEHVPWMVEGRLAVREFRIGCIKVLCAAAMA
jgi:hypothetical protein